MGNIHSHSKNCWDGPVVLNRCLQTSFLFLVLPNLTLSISVEFGTSDTPLSYRIRFTGQQCCSDLLSWSFIHQNTCSESQMCPDTVSSSLCSPKCFSFFLTIFVTLLFIFLNLWANKQINKTFICSKNDCTSSVDISELKMRLSEDAYPPLNFYSFGHLSDATQNTNIMSPI